MNKRTIILLITSVFILIALILFVIASTMFPAFRIYHGPAHDRTGINKIDPELLEQIDQRIRSILVKYNYINVAIVIDDKIALTKSYGHDRLNKVDVYASVSKPVTAMILLQLLNQGRIDSLDDNIAKYHPKYRNVIPQQYADAHITFKQLLTHTSGVSHLSKLWEGSKLNMYFQPGQNVQYSSNAYGILGDVMEKITGKSYKQLIKEYISKPIGAESFKVLIPTFLAPAGQVASTIEDMALFAIAVMDGKYISTDMLCNDVLKQYAEDRYGAIGLGWYCTNLESPNLAGYHAGSNGRPRAFLAIKPHKKNAIALTGLNRSSKNPQLFGELTIDLMKIIENHSITDPNSENK
jgi:CubicO group peptidase (beta-lactamase class C family)